MPYQCRIEANLKPGVVIGVSAADGNVASLVPRPLLHSKLVSLATSHIPTFIGVEALA